MRSDIKLLMDAIVAASNDQDRVLVTVRDIGTFHGKIPPAQIQELLLPGDMLLFLLDDGAGIGVRIEDIGGIDFPTGPDTARLFILNPAIYQQESGNHHTDAEVRAAALSLKHIRVRG